MIWFILSLGAALGVAAGDVLTKKYFSHLPAYGMGLVRGVYAFLWLAGIFLYIDWIAPVPAFWAVVASALPLEILAFYLYMKAIKLSPLSLTVPFLAFTPMFVILTGRLILGETINAGGLAGILLIVTGSYVLNLSHVKGGWLRPFIAVFKEPGSRTMLAVSFIYSLTSTLGKLAIQYSEPVFFGALYNLLLFTIFMGLSPFAASSSLKKILEKPWAGLLLGAVVSVTVLCHMVAISKIQAAYMISIKRTSILFSVLLGAWVFKEEKLRERLSGALLMLAGVLMIAFSA